MLVIGARHPERGSTPPPALVKNGGEYGKEKVVGTGAQHLQAGAASPCIKNRRNTERGHRAVRDRVSHELESYSGRRGIGGGSRPDDESPPSSTGGCLPPVLKIRRHPGRRR